MIEIMIYGPIGIAGGITASEVVDEIAQATKGGTLLVRINSAGGSFVEGLAVYNAIAGYDGEVITQIEGVSESMASLIAQAGSRRRISENGVMMVHGAQSVAQGSAADFRETADMMDKYTEAMVSGFTARGIAEKQAREWLSDGKDHVFTAQQAKDAGLVDEITAPVDLLAAIGHIPESVRLPPRLAAYRNNHPKEEKPTMPDSKATKPGEPADQAADTITASGDVDVKAFSATRKRNITEGMKAGQQAEMKRQNAIRAFFDRPQFSDPDRIGADNVKSFEDLRDNCLGNCSVTVDGARDAALDLQDGMPSPIVAISTQTQAEGSSFGTMTAPPMAAQRATSRQHQQIITAGQDAADKYIAGVTEALEIKSGFTKDRKTVLDAQRGNEFLSMTPVEMARVYLQMNRVQPVAGGRREQIVGQAMVTAAGIAHSSSDFANILENVANKAMMRGWDQAEETWMNWARTGTLPDFKPGSRVNLSTFGDLDIIYENGEYRYGSFSDLKEPLQLATYGKLFGISRQALANDDLSALSRIPMSMGRAAARKIGDLAYGVLISNPVLNQDSTELFHADHNNLGTAAAMDVAPGGSLDEAKQLMSAQTDPAGTRLNIRPRHLIVPDALEISGTSIIADKTYADSNAAQERANPFQGKLRVTSDGRLDEDSLKQWYVLSDGELHDTVEVAFLNGQQTPYLESKDGWSTDGVEYKVRIDAVAAALDFRTMVRNAGPA